MRQAFLAIVALLGSACFASAAQAAEELSKLGFKFYAPAKQLGIHSFQSAVVDPFTVNTLHLSYYYRIELYEWKAGKQFTLPPITRPASSELDGRLGPERKVGTTKNGRTVYVRPYLPYGKYLYYFRIGDTNLAIPLGYGQTAASGSTGVWLFDEKSLLEFVNSLAEVNPDRLDASKIEHERKSRELQTDPDHHVNFKVYLPRYSNAYKKEREYFLLAENDSPYYELHLKHPLPPGDHPAAKSGPGTVDSVEVNISEYKVPSDYRPPQSCGGTPPFYSDHYPAEGAAITTPGGKQIWTDDRRNSHVRIGDTVITVSPFACDSRGVATDDKTELIQLIDSMREVKPSQAKYGP